MTFFAAILALTSAVVGLGANSALAATSGEYSGRLTFRLSEVNPVVVTAESTGLVTVVGRYTNSGPDTIDGIEFRFQRGLALATPAEVAAEVKDPGQPSTVVTDFLPLPGTLEAGASAPFAITVPVFAARSSSTGGTTADAGTTGTSTTGTSTPDAASLISSLNITEPGVYPLMMNVNATVHVGGASAIARVGELHLLLTVASVPATVPGTGPGASTGGALASTSIPVSILWPLASVPHLGVGGVFANDDLARDLTAGGRIATAIDALQATYQDPTLVTIVVDPMLLDEMQHMADGYRVSTAPNSAQERLRADGSIPKTVPGTGTAAAAGYLQELRQLAATHKVLVLPYGDADVSALTRSGMTTEATNAVTRGRDIATRVLVRGPQASDIYSNIVTDVAAPPDGATTDETATLLTGLGDRAAILAPNSVVGADGKPVPAGLVTVTSNENTYDDFPAIITGGMHATQFAEILAGKVPQDAVTAVNLLAAELATAPTTARTPIVVVPPRQFTANRAGLAALTHLVDDLAESGTLVPTSISTLLGLRAEQAGGGTDINTGTPIAEAAAGPSVVGKPVTLSYSASNRRAELAIPYLRRIDELHHRIDALDDSLSRAEVSAGGADPQRVLGPLTDALLPAASAAWRGSVDPAAHQLETIDSTLVWLYGGVQISRDTGSYTLASSTAPLMLTVKNALPYQVSVTIAIVGGAQAGLSARDPGPVTIGAGPRSVPVKLETTVSRSGTFTVYAQLYAAGGSQWAGAVPLTIDSRAYGALTVILMGAAGGVLVLMVIWRLVQRIRGRIDDPDNAVVDPDSLPIETPND